MPPRSTQQFSFQLPKLRPGVRGLLVALAVLSIGTSAIGAWGSGELGGRLAQALALQPATLFRGHLWKLFTYTLFEPSPFGLLITGLLLWMFASALEQAWGTRRFLTFYFATTALAGVGGALIGLVAPSVGAFANVGGVASLEALVAGFALSFPSSTILFAFVLPISARALIPISLGVTLLFVLMTGDVARFVVPLLALGAGVLLVDMRTPGQLWLRLRVWWIERRMRARRLHVVKGVPEDDDLPSPRSGGRGSDNYLH